jgi:hypothetical protein
MDTRIDETRREGQRSGQARDFDTRTRRPAHLDEIAGWGSDLDRANRPGVPMERRPPRLPGLHTDEPELQEAFCEVLHSSERPGLTPLFGSAQPPRGVSGWLRRIAFGYSENDLRHWLMLLAADRINMVEGLFSDVATGHIPRLYAEAGGRAELKHNPARAAGKAIVLVGIVGLGYLAWRRSRSRR